jgi:uncharacterized membrane protein
MAEAINIVMRWLHISSAVTLIGGTLYARLVLAPRLQAVSSETRDSLDSAAAAGFRPLVFAAIGGLLISGLYNVFSNPGHTARYHMMLGIKILLALHVFAVSILSAQPKNPRRTRLMSGALISGLAIILISAYLRRTF